MTTYQRERLADLWTEVSPLLEAHWREIATYQDIPLEPDVERYNAMEAAGIFRAFTARRDGVLVGYAGFIVAGNMHYRSTLMAVQDVLFVSPACRRAGVGLGLIRFCDAALKAEGVVVAYQHQKVAHPALGAVLKHRGYQHNENIWVKRLDKPGER